MAECFISPVLDTDAEQDDVFIPGRFQGTYQDESTYEHGPSGSLADLLSWARSRARVVVVHLPGPDGMTQHSAGVEPAGDLPGLPRTI